MSRSCDAHGQFNTGSRFDQAGGGSAKMAACGHDVIHEHHALASELSIVAKDPQKRLKLRRFPGAAAPGGLLR